MNFYHFIDTIKKPAFITPWTYTHFLAGIWTYGLFHNFITKDLWLNFIIFICIHGLYEVKDLMLYFKISKKNSYWGNNSPLNSLGDLIFATIGFFLGASMKNISNLNLALLILLFLILVFTCNYYKSG